MKIAELLGKDTIKLNLKANSKMEVLDQLCVWGEKNRE